MLYNSIDSPNSISLVFGYSHWSYSSLADWEWMPGIRLTSLKKLVVAICYRRPRSQSEHYCVWVCVRERWVRTNLTTQFCNYVPWRWWRMLLVPTSITSIDQNTYTYSESSFFRLLKLLIHIDESNGHKPDPHNHTWIKYTTQLNDLILTKCLV